MTPKGGCPAKPFSDSLLVIIALVGVAVLAYQIGTRTPQSPLSKGSDNPFIEIPTEPQPAVPPMSAHEQARTPVVMEQTPAPSVPQERQEVQTPSQITGQSSFTNSDTVVKPQSPTIEQLEESKPILSDQRVIILPKKFKYIDLAYYEINSQDKSNPSIRFFNERELNKYDPQCVKLIKNTGTKDEQGECNGEVMWESEEFSLECGQMYISINIALWNKAKSRFSEINKDGGLHILSAASESFIKVFKIDHTIGDYAGQTVLEMHFPRDKIKGQLAIVQNLNEVIYFKIGQEAFGIQNSRQLRNNFKKFLKSCRIN